MYTEVKLEDQKNKGKMHPHKFVLWVAIGSILIMAGAAAVHLFKDVSGAWRKEPAPRDYWRLREDLDRLHDRQQGRSR